MIKVYIAAPSELRSTAQSWERVFGLNGILNMGRWVSSSGVLQDFSNGEKSGKDAQDDFTDILNSEILVALNPITYRHSGSGGRHVELGFALALSKPVILYGDRTCVFHYLPEINYLADPGDLVKFIHKVHDRRAVEMLELDSK